MHVMFNNAHTIVISHYCIFSETLPRPIHRRFRLLLSLPRLRFSSHQGEFAPCKCPIVLSSIVLNPIATLAQLPGWERLGAEWGRKSWRRSDPQRSTEQANADIVPQLKQWSAKISRAGNCKYGNKAKPLQPPHRSWTFAKKSARCINSSLT